MKLFMSIFDAIDTDRNKQVENTVPSQTQVLDDNITIESSRSQQFSRSKIQT